MARKKYRDEVYADDEASDEQENKEDVLEVHRSKKSRARRLAEKTVEKAATQPGFRTMCCRYTLFLLVVGLGLGMIVQLYSTCKSPSFFFALPQYCNSLPFLLFHTDGEYVTDAIFPPRISSAGNVCPNGTLTNDYMAQFEKFETLDNKTTLGWMYLNATRPKESLRMAWTKEKLIESEWQDTYLKIKSDDADACVQFIVWSV